MLPNDLLPLENFWKLKKRNSNNNTNVKKHKQNQNSTEFLKTFTHSQSVDSLTLNAYVTW